MLEPCVCLDLVFEGWDTPAAIDAVAEAGINAFEIWGWRDKDIERIRERAEQRQLTMVAMSLDPAVRIVDEGNVPEFLRSVRESIEAANRLHCGRLVVHVQEVPHGTGEPWYSSKERMDLLKAQRSNIAKALKAAAPFAEDSGVALMIEPLNTLVDHDGYCLSCSRHGIEVLKEVDSPAVRMLYDIYHMQVSEGNIINNITENIGFWGHIHVADAPGRHDPGTGEINFINVLTSARRAGYDGYVGMEYIPLQEPVVSIKATADIIRAGNRE
ncbi:MAG: TIM barrel protein [Armatimonadetes bacterium]|nr:TIM barrel protein [Armatimonadota bacterium]